MSDVRNTKKYLIECADGPYKMFVSAHDDGLFVSGVIYCKKQGSWAKNEDVILSFELKTFAASSEKEAVKQGMEWVKTKIAPDAQFIPIEKK